MTRMSTGRGGIAGMQGRRRSGRRESREVAGRAQQRLLNPDATPADQSEVAWKREVRASVLTHLPAHEKHLQNDFCRRLDQELKIPKKVFKYLPKSPEWARTIEYLKGLGKFRAS